MRYRHWIGFALFGSIAASLAAQGTASVRTGRARISSPGLVPPVAQAPVEDVRRKRVTAQPEMQLAEPQEVDAPPDEPAPSSSVDQGDRLDVMCMVAGSANKLDIIEGHGSQDFSGSFRTLDGTFGSFDGSGSSSATIYAPRQQGFGDQVNLFIENGAGRVRMPRVMLPLFRGGKDGWFKLKNIKISLGEITASVAINVINNPKLRLDRHTGAISVSGKAGDFVGRCRKFDPATAKRAF